MYARSVNGAGGDFERSDCQDPLFRRSPLATFRPEGRQARRRFAGLLFAYSFCAGRICRGSRGAGSPERAGEWAAKYREASFRDKLCTAARKAGSAVIERALALRYVAVSGETPAWARECAHAALGYFIVPLDAVPDAAPAGFCDDLTVMATALGAVAVYVTPAIRARAARKAGKVCGPWRKARGTR